MLIGWIVVIFALAGVLMYALASNPKMVEIGRIMFAMAFLATCLALAGRQLHLP